MIRRLSVFPRMPQTQHVDGRFLDFVSHLVMPCEDASNLARLEFFKLLSDARVLQEADRGCSQSLHGASCGAFVDRRQEVVKSHQIGKSFTRPFQFHQRGVGSGLSVSRLAAHACTSWWSITQPASTSANASSVSRRRSSSCSTQADNACLIIQPRERSKRAAN